MLKQKVYILEDEKHNLELLTGLLLEKCSDLVEIAGSSGSILHAMEALKVSNTDILFLDIELEDGQVFDLLTNIDYRKYKIVFITGYAEHAIRAIKFGALDYLLKPIAQEELVETVTRVCSIPLRTNEALDDFISKKAFSLTDHLLVHHNTFTEKVPMEKISYLEADGAYTIIHHGAHSIISTKPIGFYEEVLPLDIFCRCHKSYIVNKYHIKRIDKGRGLGLTLFSGAKLPVAVRKKEEFNLWFGQK